ncbi:aspartate carbamoyltransferase catalytic subunit [Candidatus Latescibacterota bacterium]
MAFGLKHLFGLQGVSKEDITVILDAAETFREVLDRPIRIVPTLKGVAVLNLFYEDSTRTRISFELAERRLSAEVVSFAKSASSVSKGESLRDTVRNIEAMKIDVIVVRHSSAGVPRFLARHTNCIIINAGDGTHEHPTQALLDMLTMRQHFGTLEGLRVLIVGDILHSRVARSEIWGLLSMGARVDVCGPATLIPLHLERFNVAIHTDFDAVVGDYDVVYMLRIQRERQDSGLIPSSREYTNLFGLTRERVRRMKDGAVVMHPGPINRGIELDYDVADSARSLILNQVTNGEAVRMAVLFLLTGRSEDEGA